MRNCNSGRNYKFGLNYTITCDYIGGIFHIFNIQLGLKIGVTIFLYISVTIFFFKQQRMHLASIVVVIPFILPQKQVLYMANGRLIVMRPLLKEKGFSHPFVNTRAGHNPTGHIGLYDRHKSDQSLIHPVPSS